MSTLATIVTIIITLVIVALVAAWLLGRRYAGEDHSRYDLPQDDLVVQPEQISSQHDDTVRKLQDFHRQSGVRVEEARERMEELFFQEVDAEIKPVDVDGVPGEWVLAEGADPDRRLLYLHGGAFRVGSPRSHRYLTAELSRRAGLAVLAIDYRMLPEHKIRACHEDARTAYAYVLQHGPNGESAPAELYVAGDSAGGNLTLSLIAWARDKGLRTANAAIGLAPATDGTFGSETWKTNVDTDPFLGPSIGRLMKMPRPLLLFIQRLSGGLPPNDPMLSPIHGRLDHLPPLLIQASKDELLYGDIQRYVNKAREAGTDVTLELWPRLVHVFHGFGPDLPEAVDALERIARFIATHSTSHSGSRPESG